MDRLSSTVGRQRPKLAVFKFASCDGCQLSILNLEEDLLALGQALEIAYFPEASSDMDSGPYDIALVEGSITTAVDAHRILTVRKETKVLITIGACATAGGIQSLRNWADVEAFKQAVYPNPEYIKSLSTSTPISEHVHVDFELWGCPMIRVNSCASSRIWWRESSHACPATVCVWSASDEEMSVCLSRRGCLASGRSRGRAAGRSVRTWDATVMDVSDLAKERAKGQGFHPTPLACEALPWRTATDPSRSHAAVSRNQRLRVILSR